MAYTAAFEPKVIRTYPRNLAVEIPAKAEIKIDFNTDLDRDYVSDYIQVFNSQGQRLSGITLYDERSVTFKADSPFGDYQTIKVLVIGDDLSGTENGIRSVLGERMRGDYLFTFTTQAVENLPAPSLIQPVNQSIIQREPVFNWSAVTGAESYQIEVSTSNTLNPVIWPVKEADYRVFDISEPLVPDTSFADGNYYWRVRAISPDGVFGEWSITSQFSKDTHVEGVISEEDVVTDEHPFFEEMEDDGYLEILSVFPQEDFSNVALNLKVVYIHVAGTFTQEQVVDSITIEGTYVDGDDSDPTLIHGEVEPEVIQVYPQNDGTTIIAFQFPEMEVDE